MTKTASITPELLQVFEAVPDLYLIISTDLTILTASKLYLKATLQELDTIRGKNIFEAFPDNPALFNAHATANLQKSLEWVLKHKEPHHMALQRYDVPHPKMSGTFLEKYWHPTNTPVLDDEENILYIIHKVEDATPRIMAQKGIEEGKKQLQQLYGEQETTNIELVTARAEVELEQRKLHNLLMQAPAMICIFEGPEHVFKFANPPYQQLVGNRPILGKPIAEAMPELAGQPIFTLLDTVYRTGESFYAYEMKVQLDHDNSGALGDNYYNFTYQATRNMFGEIEGIMVFAYEVTVQVEARQKVEQREQDLKILNHQLSAANEELSVTQLALQELNHELEDRVARRTKELEISKAETEIQRYYLQQLFMEAPAPIIVLNGPELIFQLVNPASQQIFPGRELQGKPLLQALPELEGTAIPDILNKVYKTGETYVAQELPLMLSRYDNAPQEEMFWTFTYQARRNQHGKIEGVQVFAYEVTEQVIARKVVEQNVNQLRLLTDALPVLIGYLDKEEKYRFANKAYETWFPLKREEMLGRAVREVIGEKAYDGVKTFINRALAGERLNFESKMPYREDFTKYIRTSYVPEIKDGEVAGFYTLVNDITEQVVVRQEIEEREKEARALTNELAAKNEELSKTNELLKRINVDLDNFIYTASHDLKAPIYNIEGLLQIIIQSIPAEVQVANDLENLIQMIGDSINRFKRTIEHLTDVTRLHKEYNQEAVIVNLDKVIQDVKMDLSTQIEAVGAELKVNVSACPDVRFSEKNLRSVIYNLLSNAIKYNSHERTPEIEISCYPEKEFIVLKVKDNGLGMEMDSEQKLFAMFGRLHDHVEGSGIGLYMVKRIVENVGGKIEVESKVGVGSTFRVYLKAEK